MAEQTSTPRTVTGRVRETAEGVAVEIGPLPIGPGENSFAVEFDKPVPIPLSVLFPDPAQLRRVEDTVGALLSTEETRFDELLKVAGMDPSKDLAGSDLSGIELDGTPELPLDMRGWDLNGANLDGAIVGHILVDGSTRLAGITIAGATGPGAAALVALASRS
jgi:hypothetical protein